MSNYIYGKNSFFEALKSGRILMAYVQDDRLIKDKGIPYKVVDRKKLDGLCRGGNHQGYVAEVKDFKLSAVDEMVKERNGLIVMLDGLEDVHNLGAIIRTANLVGAHGVIIPKDRAVGLTATVAKASAGAINYTPVVKVTNLVKTMEELKKRGLWFVCADMDGTTLTQLNLTGPIGLVIGAEGSGVSRLVRESCDMVASIPQRGEIDSLNASVAAGVLCYEILRQRMA